MAFKKGTEVATIDVAMVTITTRGASPVELALTTSNKVDVAPATETTDAIKNIVKGVLIAQKPSKTIITGNAITMTDNVFNAELVKILQGGTILYWQDPDHQSPAAETPTNYGIASYIPPAMGSDEEGEVFDLSLYSAIYNAAGLITGYEKCTYPNCQGQPVAFGSEDDVFRAPEYTVNSAPDTGEPPYRIDYVDSLPVVAKRVTVSQTLTHVTSSNMSAFVETEAPFTTILTAESGYTLGTPVVMMGGIDITASAWTSGTSTIAIANVTGNISITASATE